MSYTLYFLLDRTESIVPKDFIDLATKDPNITFQLTPENEVELKYKDNNLVFEASIFIKNKSIIPNIHLLNPKYKNVNMNLEISPLFPRFKVSLFLDKIYELIKKFDLAIYNEFLNDVEPYKKDDILYTYDMYKKAYFEKYPEEKKNFYFVDRTLLNDYLTYEKEFSRVKKLYLESEIIVPELIYYVEDGFKQVKTAVEWNGETKLLIPPFIDYVIYIVNGDKKIYIAKEFNMYLGKYMTNVPGFIPGTKVIIAKKLAKCKKVISKAKFSLVLKKFKSVNQTNLID